MHLDTKFRALSLAKSPSSKTSTWFLYFYRLAAQSKSHNPTAPTLLTDHLFSSHSDFHRERSSPFLSIGLRDALTSIVPLKTHLIELANSLTAQNRRRARPNI